MIVVADRPLACGPSSDCNASPKSPVLIPFKYSQGSRSSMDFVFRKFPSGRFKLGWAMSLFARVSISRAPSRRFPLKISLEDSDGKSTTRPLLSRMVAYSLAPARALWVRQTHPGYAAFQILIHNFRLYPEIYDIRTDHFKGRAWNKGMRGVGRPRKTLDEILVPGSTFQSYKLKKRLFGAGLKNAACEECGWAEKARDGRVPLELDHINGDPRDNRIENLRILCPNCHSLKATHRGRNRRNRQGR